ncbi:MAG: hypothetical protein IJM63_02055 [Solobacterium sp.]|nr:hypothetical protein [Solobacterium sp.]
MKKILLALCLFLTGCTLHRSEAVQNDYDFRLAVIDNGTTDCEITYYDSDFHELGRTVLENRHVNSSHNISAQNAFHDHYVYIPPAAGQWRQSELIRMDLNNGSIDYVPVEMFDTEALLADEEKLILIQSSSHTIPYFRSEIPYEGSTGKVTRYKDGELPGLYYPLDEGWLRFRDTLNTSLIQYDSQFVMKDELLLGINYLTDHGTPEEYNPWRPYGKQSVLMNGSLYVPAQQELREWNKVNEEYYEPGDFLGYKYGFMKISTDPLRYEVIENEGVVYTAIEQLDETRILMVGMTQTMTAVTEGDDTSYRYENSLPELVVFDTAAYAFDSVKTSFVPSSLSRDEEYLYVTDTDMKIHILNPVSLQELNVLDHQGSDPYSTAQIIPSKPYR